MQHFCVVCGCVKLMCGRLVDQLLANLVVMRDCAQSGEFLVISSISNRPKKRTK